jgi:hypothetical protein
MMWPKEDYQEHMLGYLDWVQTEIERLEQGRIRRNDLDELYDDLEVALERLWRLIGVRYMLEASCDELLHAFYRVPHAGSLILSVSLAITENHESRSQLWKQAEML